MPRAEVVTPIESLIIPTAEVVTPIASVKVEEKYSDGKENFIHVPGGVGFVPAFEFPPEPETDEVDSKPKSETGQVESKTETPSLEIKHRILAKFSSRCRVFFGPIDPGARICKTGSGWVHWYCVNKDDEFPPQDQSLSGIVKSIRARKTSTISKSTTRYGTVYNGSRSSSGKKQ